METVQIFVSNPQGWAWPKPRPDGEAFAKGAREMGLSPVVVHSKYLINLASPEAEHRERSAKVLAAELEATLGQRVALCCTSTTPVNELGSRRDGHERIGECRISEEAWAEFFAVLPGIPVVMETPYATPEVDAEQVRLVKELAGGLPLSSKGV